MSKFIENSEKLKKFTQYMYDYFEKVTGMKLAALSADDLLKYISEYAEQESEKGKQFKELEEAVTKAVTDKAYPLLETTMKNAPRKFTDNEFYNIMETFLFCMGNINSAYRRDHDLGYTMNEQGVYSGITKDKMINLYEQTVQGKKSNYEEYQEQYSKVKKNHSKTLVDELNNRVENCKEEADIQSVAVVYKTLKEKQKRNSFWTNWLTKKGYQERKALKDCEEKLHSRFSLKFTGRKTGEKLEEMATELKPGLKTFEDNKEGCLDSFKTQANKYAKEYTRVKTIDENLDKFLKIKLDGIKREIMFDGQKINAEEAENELLIGDERPSFEMDNEMLEEKELTNN